MKMHARVLNGITAGGLAAAATARALDLGWKQENEAVAARPVDADLLLIQRLQDGDDEALNELMERHATPLFRFVYRFTGNETDAADLVQETFVKVYLNRAKFEPKAKFRTWLYTIAKNLCRDWARSRKRKPLLTVGEIFESEMLAAGASDMPRTEIANPREETAREEEARALRAAIAGLPEDLRSGLILFCLEEHSQEEAAILLGCTAKAVETRVYRAKKILRQRLGRLRGG
jgi:RNA polymerase sigma-70 factor (ECF subfamily)